ncbi:hypothetical protein [Gilliamella sp. wkB178]|uniref:hypothetical protein n=1 Tax=Gilliamella sp. wkB178 TaxID=3120259 RepID=UPI0011469450|nr:hypothetical protein [Gilliamella apicola]
MSNKPLSKEELTNLIAAKLKEIMGDCFKSVEIEDEFYNGYCSNSKALKVYDDSVYFEESKLIITLSNDKKFFISSSEWGFIGEV